MKIKVIVLFAAMSAAAQTNSPTPTNHAPAPDRRAAEVRAACINGRRAVCGKVIKIVADGLVVDSGYTGLLAAPFNRSWVVSGGATPSRDPKLMELDKPASPCVGLVLLTDIPKRPAVKLYDFVVLQAYPCGQFNYVPVPGVEKTIRKFSAGIDTAIKLNLNLRSQVTPP